MVNSPLRTSPRKLRYESLEPRQMLSATARGDYNANGFIDASDYVVWRATLHTSVPVAGDAADGNRDAIIGAEDFGVWRNNFGTLGGDYNTNGSVDAADFVVWRASLRTTMTTLGFAGDGNQDQIVGPDDYNMWRANFGHAGPQPPVVNWFDTNIQDSALRTLGHDLYLDGLIDRSDMLALFTSAEDDGVLDAVEFSDLQAITAKTSLFDNLEYVAKLSSYVVAGNAANAQYQGQSLGNLAAGSSSIQLQNLVNKWFLGLDRPATPSNYAPISGTLFVDGPSYTDVNQGNVRDCYILSSLAETALKTPAAITNMFIINGDGTYTLRFYNNTQAEYVTVDSYLPVDGADVLVYAGIGKRANDPANELWVSLAEKAYAQINEMGWLRPFISGNGQNNYAAIAGGYIYAALGQITGQATAAFNMTLVPTNFALFVDAYNQNKLIGFSSKSAPASAAVVANHAYAVVSYNEADQTITLFNPWGVQFGLLTMTWAEIQGSFTHFDRTA